MIVDAFNLILFNPLYNGLIFLVDIVPFGDVGLAVILLTIIVKLILFPLSMKAVRSQLVMRKLAPKLEEIKKKYKDDRQKQAQEMMGVYKEHNLNPISPILVILIQLPVIFALYWLFFRGGLPEVNMDIIYGFVSAPEMVNMQFLGLIDMAGRSMILAALAGITQYFQIKLSMPEIKERKNNASMKDDLARSFQLQMRYGMPVIVTIVAFIISSAVALYWLTSNLFTIGQELYVRRRFAAERAEVDEAQQS